MESTLDALRALRLAEPGLGVKMLVAKLREQQPGLEIGAKEVREMCRTLDEEQPSAKKRTNICQNLKWSPNNLEMNKLRLF